MEEFSGLAALVTGGASGIGLATARWLSARGAHVAVLDRDMPGRTGDEEVRQSVLRAGAVAHVRKGDIASLVEALQAARSG